MGRISRRTFLRGVAGVGALGVLSTVDRGLADEGPQSPVSMAMHVHSSFSEGTGSMRWQLDQAALGGVDVVWWSDHDWRMSGHGFRREVHFTGQTESEDGNALTWKSSKKGKLSSWSGTIVSSPASPLDPVGPSSLRLDATGTKSTFATWRWTADAAASRQNHRGTLAGMTIQIEVYPQSVGPNAYLEVLVTTSQLPSVGGRPAGTYVISYRVGGPDAPGTIRTEGILGIVTLAAPAGSWTSLALTPSQDIARLWPDVEPLDGALYDLSLGVASRSNARATGCFDYLRFARTLTGDQPLEVQRSIMTAYHDDFSPAQLQGLEVSLDAHHVNWFGGQVTLPDYGTKRIQPTPNSPAATRDMVSMIHGRGGIASYNHMFGTNGGVKPDATQETKRRKVAANLISQRVFGADLLEVGYRERGGVDLARHLAVWDACSRNAIFTTGTGVNDIHGGVWTTQANRFLTFAWAQDSAEQSLTDALGAGRITFGDMGFSGAIDLLVDGVCPMGSASVSNLTTRRLRISASGLPAGSSARVIQGPVDLAGPGSPDPATSVVGSVPGSAFAAGDVDIDLNASAASFVRVEVLDEYGRTIGGSNPVWLLQGQPPGGIPVARAV